MPSWFGKRREETPPPVEVVPEEKPMRPAAWSTTGLILENEDGDLGVNTSTLAEAKLVIKDAKLRQKALRAEKRQVSSKMTEIRAEYRLQNARRGPAMRGGGNLGKFVRGLDQTNKAMARSAHARNLQPYEEAKAALDKQIFLLDRLIHSVEAHLLANESTDGDE